MATVFIASTLIAQAADLPETVKFSVAKADVENMPAETKAKLKDAEVLDFSLEVDGKKVSEFDGRSDVQVAINYTLQPGEDQNKVVIYYIDDNGALVIVNNGKYNAETGKVEFKPKHFGKYAAAYVDVSFEDVTKEWAKQSIEALAARGIVSGIGEGEFNPDGEVTRAEFIAMLMNLFELTDPDARTNFSDVQEAAWYYEEIAAAHQLGIVSGRADGSFGANDQITRQDMAVMAYQASQYAQLELKGESVQVFADQSNVSPYAQKGVTAMQKAGIINGMGNGSYEPKSAATRAQAAVIMNKLLELL